MLNRKGKQKVLEEQKSNVSLYRKVIERSKSSSDDDIWLITMSDLMSLLLICFIMFFVMVKNKEVDIDLKMDLRPDMADAAEVGVPVKSPDGDKLTVNSVENLPESMDITGIDDKTKQYANAVETIKSELDEYIKSLDLGNKVITTIDNDDIVITLKEEITFRSASAELIDDASFILENIASIINENESCIVEIDGHTDNLPINTPLYPSNFELSLARATSVLDFFSNMYGLDENRFFIRGNADMYPVFPNDSAENRAKNRRVEIRLRAINDSRSVDDVAFDIDNIGT